jgi:hypothetical protein
MRLQLYYDDLTCIYETIRERDIDVCRDCFVGLPRQNTMCVRVKILGKRF